MKCYFAFYCALSLKRLYWFWVIFMKIYGMENNNVLLNEIGLRIKAKRIAMNMTQADLALESGASLRTIAKVESGSNISLIHLIAILRTFRMAANLDLLIPETKTNPIEIFDFGKKRQRASRKKGSKTSTWKWGDEK